MSKHLKIGKLGEDIACRYLEQKGFVVKEKNYWKKWGEIDIVAEKGGVIRFIEVKTVSRDLPAADVIHETQPSELFSFKAEDAVTPWKIKRMRRVMQSYLLEKDVSPETCWQFDVVSVYLDMAKKQAKIRFFENMII